jgi:hypothetical protein
MKITIEISDEDAAFIRRFTNATVEENSTHGRLSIKTLATMILEDVAVMVQRPGCWEAQYMHALLAAHGYEDAADCV